MGPPVIVMGQPAHAQALYALGLGRSAANLAGPYADIVGQINAALATSGVVVDRYAVLPQYGSITGAPALVWGNPSMGGELSAALTAAATSGSFDAPIAGVTAEQFNLATLAAGLDTATLPPELTNGSSAPFFAPPNDVFLVVTIQPDKRLCADTDPACAVNGAAPVTAFSAAAADGTAAWLRFPAGSYPQKHVYQAFIATGENETTAQFQAKCSGVPGFPKALLDVMEPSPVPYYTDLATGLTAAGWAAEEIDLCDLLGANGSSLVKSLAGHVAQAAAASSQKL
jgi:hypothetical protein